MKHINTINELMELLQSDNNLSIQGKHESSFFGLGFTRWTVNKDTMAIAQVDFSVIDRLKELGLSPLNISECKL